MQLTPAKRDIGLIVKAEGELLSIHSNNFYTGTVTMENDLPRTTQEESRP